MSAYNLNYVKDVVKLLTPNWPDVVSFGIPHQPHFRESVIPIKHRDRIIVDLQSSVIEIQQAEIESGQKSHAVNALTSVINNLQTQPWDHVYYKEFQKFVSDMDRVKHMQIRDYCADVADMLTE